MTKRDYYEVLGLSRDASLDEIKKTYRQCAMKYHPDRNPGDKECEEKFKEATEAYQILSDQSARAKYDQFGHAAFAQGGGFEGFGDFSGFEDIFGDIFGSFFGGAMGGGRKARGRSGRDLRYDLELDFEEAIFGTEKQVRISRRVLCESCEGSGAKKGTSPQACRQCGGSGQQRFQQGFFTISRTCSGCQGSGEVVSDPCAECRGVGLKSAEATLSVKVPAGIDAGQRLKLRGEGESGQAGGPSGDLYVQIAVKEHPFFKREESELYCELPISYPAAVLGAEVDVPTLEGKVKMKVPPGTPSGKLFKLKNRGVQVLGSSRRGDLHVRVFIEVPTKLNDEHRRTIEKLKEIEGFQPNPEAKGFFEKVKDMFA